MVLFLKLIQICIYKTSGNRVSNRSLLCRYMSSSEITTALKPFYFSVHPDLFGQHPTERDINDSSLKVLSSFIETVKSDKPTKATTLKFYLRPQGAELEKGNLKCVHIHLKERCMRRMVSSILASCNLPTTYVDGLKRKYSPDGRSKYKKINGNHAYSVEYEETMVDFEDSFDATVTEIRYEECLSSWLTKNAKKAKDKVESCKVVRNEVIRLKSEITSALGLKDLLLDCGWNIAHYKGCLTSFQTLIDHHPQEMDVLKGRILVFGSYTGVSFDGHILLNSGEVRRNWLDFFKRVPGEDEVVLKLPSFEKCVSMVLCDIKVVRRKFQPKTMAQQYQNNLKRLTTSLNDYKGRYGFPRCWPTSLNDYELVVESEAGPLMVSPTGQFIVPSSCPSSLLVNFITDNLEEAKILNTHYQRDKHIEKDLVNRCVNEFKLHTLHKDDCITPNLMIRCCAKLLENKEQLGSFLHNTHLHVTNYYSIMSDGQMCIPWNWQL